jgi:hypothetical protein
MDRARQPADAARAEVSDALAHGRRRAGGDHARAVVGPPAVLALQRSAGNAAVSALLAAKLKSPGEQAVSEIDAALKEIRRDEPAIETVEQGLKAAKAAGVPVDLEGPRPPPSALAVTTTGFGPESVAAKKPVPPPKPVPAVHPLGRAGAVAARAGAGGKGAAVAAGRAPTAAPAGGGAAAPTMGPAPLSADRLLAPPVAPAAVRPQDDPAFTRVRGNIKGVAKASKAHPPAASKAREAQAAALAPSDDLAGQAKAAKVDTMDAQQAGSFDKKAFIAAVKQAIEAKSPKTLKEADDYKASGKAGEVKGEVKGLVTQGTDGQAKDLQAATEAAPDQSKAVPKPVTPMTPEQPGEAVAVPAAGAAPKPAPAEQVNLAAGKHQADQELAEGEVSEPQLARSNEPQFQQALADKQAAAAHADTAPAQFRQHEQQVIQQHKAQAAQESTQAVAGMHSAKGAALAKLVADKGKTKSKDEGKRAEVTGKIQSIFAATEAEVKKLLGGLDAKVEAAFDQGEAAARAAFESYVAAKMAAYKQDRYSGWLGGLRWAKDKLLGMPDKVNEFYQAGRELYLRQMDGVISRVADIVAGDLAAAKQRIATGKAEIAAYVKSLPADLHKVGAEASKEIGERFQQLESDVNAKQESVIDSLATRYVEARKGLDERIEALQADNKGLVDKAIGAIRAVIDTIRELAAMLKNVLARAAGVVGEIIKHPVGFLGNLIAGVKGGILKFKDNIVDHLRKGLLGWLFGALAEGGIELPDSFDVKGIIKLLASIFGLTWASIRNRLVKQIGEPAMAAAEKGVEIFQIIASQGVGGLWHMLVDKLGDIKEMILEQVKDFVVTKIITAGITWLIGLLNPAAAFIKACKLIYDVVMFFVNNASRIAKFVNTVIDSVADIVRGNISGVVNKINDVLGQMVPILIGFLASVIGLGGIGEKIRQIIQTLQKPVKMALDWVIKTGLKLAGPLIRGLKRIGGKVKAKVAAGKAWIKGKAEAGKEWGKKKAAGVTDAFRRIKERMLGITFRESFQAGGERHEIYSKKGKPQEIYTASKNPRPSGKAVSDPAVAQLDGEFRAKMSEYYRLASGMTGAPSDRVMMTEANKLWRQAKAILKNIVALTKKEMDSTGGGPGGHAPHIGDAAPHRMQQSRLRPADKGKEITAWRMESEHLIPRELISAFFSILPINAPVSDAEYDAMVTVLMYQNASKEKTTAAAVGDLASIRKMKQLAREKMQTLPARGQFPASLLEQIRAEIQQEFEARGRNSVSRAAAAVVAEQQAIGDARGKGAQARPTKPELTRAYEAQFEQVLELLKERVKAVERLRAQGKQ